MATMILLSSISLGIRYNWCCERVIAAVEKQEYKLQVGWYAPNGVIDFADVVDCCCRRLSQVIVSTAVPTLDRIKRLRARDISCS